MQRTLLFLIAFGLTMCLPIRAAEGGSGLGDIPKSVNASEARFLDVGVVASDVYQWVTEDSVTHLPDTVYTVEQYILWEKDGDIDEQAAARRAAAPRKGQRRAISPSGRTGSLYAGWLAEYHYNVFTYEYPSVDADGNEVMLSSIAACPTKDGGSEVRDVVIGTHITITKNDECPSHTTKGFDTQDWGVLMSLAGGKKIKFGYKTNLLLGYLTGTVILAPFALPIWAEYGIATEVVSAEPSNNYNLVIMPDYEGYGSTYKRAHPYLYQELTARQVVDATRYGIALYKGDPNTAKFRHPLRKNFRTMSCGYSQGGSVALATHRFIEQNGLVDELHFVGSLCGDGPYDPMSTLMYYVEQDLKGKRMSMAVVMPLIIKGMLDTNPYMKSHKASDYFSPEFLNTGIMDWIANKNYTTDDIASKFAKEGGIFDSHGRVMMRDAMNNACYQYFLNLYNDYKNSYKQASGIPLPSHRGVMEDLHLALASNDMTYGWTPQHAILLFHSTSDTVVPYDNAEKAKNSFGGWAVLHSSKLGHDHVPAGTDFFQSDDKMDIAKSLTIRTFVAKKKLCDLPWNGQTLNNIPKSW